MLFFVQSGNTIFVYFVYLWTSNIQYKYTYNAYKIVHSFSAIFFLFCIFKFKIANYPVGSRGHGVTMNVGLGL